MLALAGSFRFGNCVVRLRGDRVRPVRRGPLAGLTVGKIGRS